MTMLRELMAAEALADTLAATAPLAVTAAGGAHALVRLYGRPSGALFWRLDPFPDALWEAMAAESAEGTRGLSPD